MFLYLQPQRFSLQILEEDSFSASSTANISEVLTSFFSSSAFSPIDDITFTFPFQPRYSLQ